MSHPRNIVRLLPTVEILEARIAPAGGVFRWNNVDGSWNSQANWVPVSGNVDQGFPNSPDDEAIFSNLTATHTVTIPNGIEITVGKITFNDDNNMNVVASGTGHLVMESLGDTSTISTASTGTFSISAPITLNDETFVAVGGTDSFTLSGVISGAGSNFRALTKTGTGTLILGGTQANTFTSYLTINDGTVSITKSAGVSAGGFGVLVGDETGAAASAKLVFSANNQLGSSTYVYANGDGLVDLANTNQTFGLLGLFASNGNGGSVTTGTGTLSTSGIDANSLTGSGVPSIAGKLALTGSATIDVRASDASVGLTISATISGTAGLRKIGAGVLELTTATAQTYTGTTRISDGVLVVNTNTPDAGTSSTIVVESAGTLRLAGSFEVPDAADVTVDGGKIEITGPNEDWTTLYLYDGADFYIAPGSLFRMRPNATIEVSGTTAGATFHGGGDLQLFGPSAGFGGIHSFTVTDTLADADLTLDVRLTNLGAGGGVALTGGGKTLIQRDSTNTGSISVASGNTLEVGYGAALGCTVVLAGGTLTGQGSVKGIFSTDGGRVEPAFSFSSTGNVALNAAATLSIPSASGPKVTGTVNLGGAALEVTAPLNGGTTAFTIIDNDGNDAITGTFAGLSEGAKLVSPLGNYTISYVGGDGNDVTLTPEVITPTIVAGGKTATFTDRDGDLVTVKTTLGTFTAANFRLAGAGSGARFVTLDLTTGGFDGTKISITAKRQAGGGDGHVDLGFLNAFGVDVAAISVPGDIGGLRVGNVGSNPNLGLGSLTADSFGLQSNLASPGSFFVSTINGPLGSMKIKGAFQNHQLTIDSSAVKSGSIFIGDTFGANAIGGGGRIVVEGSLGSFTVGGDIVGGLGIYTGNLTVNGTLGSLTVNGSIAGGDGSSSASVTVSQGLPLAKIKRDLRGGGGSGSGQISVGGTTGAVNIVGSIIGGDGADSGQIYAAKGLAKLTVGGDLRAGAIGSGTVESQKAIKSITIGGSVLGAGAPSILAETLGSITIKRDFAGLGTGRASIAASGVSNPADVKAATAIASLTVLGSVKNADLLAGYSDSGWNSQVNADVQIGKVMAKGNWENSRVVAGVESANSIFGDAGDGPINAGGNATIHSRIASIVIGGTLKGSATSGDASGFVAQDIGSLTIGKIKIPLSADRFTEDLKLGLYADIFVKEISAT